MSHEIENDAFDDLSPVDLGESTDAAADHDLITGDS